MESLILIRWIALYPGGGLRYPTLNNRGQQLSAPNQSKYRFICRALIAQRGRNSSCGYFDRSLGCLQLTSSSCEVRVHFRVARKRYFKCECKCCGALSCAIQKCVSLSVQNLVFEFMLHFPADRCGRLIKSKTGFSPVHPSAFEPESEIRPE